MARCTRSILLVLIGTGLALPACDERQRRGTDLPPEPDNSFGDGPAPNPTTGPSSYAAPAGGSPGLSSYGSTYRTGRSGVAWTNGTMSSRRGDGYWSRGGSFGSSSSVETSGTGTAHASSGGHVSFGGFGAHASSSHAGS